MDLLRWAEREIEIAKKRERGDGPKDEWDYGCACYDSAFKAYKSLWEDEHSGMSIMLTKRILNRLIDGKVLTPIEDTEDTWSQCEPGEYQCNRMSSLFKYVLPDGTVKYTDINRACYVDMASGTAWHSGFIKKYVDEKYPITMPYTPTDKPYMAYCEDFCYMKPDAVGEYNHFVIHYLVEPDGKRVEVEKYFQETDNGTKEIAKEEWLKHYSETFKIASEAKA